MRRGDYDAARDFYSGAAPTLAADTAPQALFLQARAEQANGDFAAAEATLQSLFAAYPETAITPSAMMLLAQVRRATGDCEGAVRALGVVMDSPAGKIYGPYPDLQRAMCLGRLGDFRGQLATAQQAMTIEGGGSRLTRIEILEEAAEASLKLGRRQDALNFYNQSLELAGSRAYRAEMLFTTATLARTLDQDELAMDRFRSVVIDYADTMRAAGALDALAEMGRHGVVSPLHAGTARLNAREYTAALGLFDQVGPEDPEWGAARFAYATTLMRMGREDEARPTLAQLADSWRRGGSRAAAARSAAGAGGRVRASRGDLPAHHVRGPGTSAGGLVSSRVRALHAQRSRRRTGGVPGWACHGAGDLARGRGAAAVLGWPSAAGWVRRCARRAGAGGDAGARELSRVARRRGADRLAGRRAQLRGPAGQRRGRERASGMAAESGDESGANRGRSGGAARAAPRRRPARPRHARRGELGSRQRDAELRRCPRRGAPERAGRLAAAARPAASGPAGRTSGARSGGFAGVADGGAEAGIPGSAGATWWRRTRLDTDSTRC